MSTKELRLDDLSIEIKDESAVRFRIKMISGMNSIYNEINRNQAHLLMLYLQEHLK